MIKSCLIVDEMHSTIIPLLEGIGVNPDYKPTIKRDEIIKIISNYEGLMIRSKTNIDEEIISQAHNLKYIARAGAGIDNLDVDVIAKYGIEIINAPEGNRDALAEHTIGMLLCLFNKILQGDSQVRSGIWDREGNRGIELMGKTIGLIGFGNMAAAFARRISGFGCRILAYDKYKSNFSNLLVEEASMSRIFKECDILSLHTPLTEETRGLVDRDFIDEFEKKIFIINTARGEILPFDTLLHHLQSGKIRGVVLDVLENEKFKTFSDTQKEQFQYLAKSDKVVFTPHVAGWTEESYIRINEVLVEKIKLFLEKA